jgi:hypothetical protein
MTSEEAQQSSTADQERTLEEIFDSFFKARPTEHQQIEKGRLQDLPGFEQQHFKDFYQPTVLSDTRAVLNGMLSAFGKRVEPPHGPATIHFDFVDSSHGNGMTFSLEDKYFIGITSRMLLDFDRASTALTGRAAVRDLLETPIDPQAVWALISVLFALHLQFIVFHELGHIVHDHTDARNFRKEYKLTPMESLLLHYPNQDAVQSKEWLADRHAVRMLLQNLIGTPRADNMRSLIKSSLSAAECVLRLLTLAIAAVFFFGPSDRFYLPLVRKRPYPCDLARLNIVMRSIVEWAEANDRQEVKTWASDTSNFEWITSCIRDAEQNPQKVEEWIAQGAFLNSTEGREYLDVIYQKDGVITPAVEERWWKLGSEE